MIFFAKFLVFVCSFYLGTCQVRRFTIDNFGDGSLVPLDPPSTQKTPKVPKLPDLSLPSRNTEKSVKIPAKVARTVLFHNNYPNHSIAVYWLDIEHSPNAVKMGDVAVNGYLNTSTFPGHVFYAIKLNSSVSQNDDEYEEANNSINRATPITIQVLNSITEYDFGPQYLDRGGKLHPAVVELNSPVKNVRFKVKSLVNPSMSVWGEDGSLIVGAIPLGQEEYLNTFEGMTVYFTPTGQPNNVLWTTIVTKNHSLVAVQDKKHPVSKKLKKQTSKQLKFHSEYLARTGIPWNQYYDVEKSVPRPPVSLFMWPAEKLGDVHSLYSKEGFWKCSGSSKKCQSKKPVALNLEVVSTAPRVFVIPNFISKFEISEIKKLAKPMLQESFIGSSKFEKQRKSETRTSSNAWVHRISGNPVTESLFLRAADLLQVPEQLLHRHTYAEELQVVHYNQGEQYMGHYDWSNSGYPETRYITILVYLTNMTDSEAGGETAFPKANNGMGFKIHPGAGSAVLFYNLLSDGNGDELTYHAALPVNKGEKWLANFWVWDPKFH